MENSVRHGNARPLRKNETMPIAATWIDLQIVILSEVSQKEKDKYPMISSTGEI